MALPATSPVDSPHSENHTILELKNKNFNSTVCLNLTKFSIKNPIFFLITWCQVTEFAELFNYLFE